MRCATCHTAANYDAVGVPGNPGGHSRPPPWRGKADRSRRSAQQIKDPARNGGATLDAIVVHMTSDPLVGWAWTPGVGREPAPGTQAAFGALVKAWADSGAACPPPSR